MVYLSKMEYLQAVSAVSAIQLISFIYNFENINVTARLVITMLTWIVLSLQYWNKSK